MTISQTISDFVTLAIKAGGWMEMDRIYLQNRVLAMIAKVTKSLIVWLIVIGYSSCP